MLSVPPERALDQSTLEILRHLNDALSEQGADYFVIGATARDILMHHVFGIPTGRTTRDVDFAIALENWDQFERIKQLLLDTGRFSRSAGVVHRLHFDIDSYGFGYPLDLIPFGGIESSANQIAWPPDKQIVMNVAGYEEALHTANLIEVEAGLSIKVISIPGLAAFLRLSALFKSFLCISVRAQSALICIDPSRSSKNKSHHVCNGLTAERFVLTRSPAFLGISDGATTMHACPSASISAPRQG